MVRHYWGAGLGLGEVPDARSDAAGISHRPSLILVTRQAGPETRVLGAGARLEDPKLRDGIAFTQ